MNIDTDKVDALFSKWNKPDSPGCALAVIKDGEIVYKRGYGMANLEHDIPIRTTTVFDIGSTSKQFTAMCVLLLARQGKIKLGDDVREYIPELQRYEQPFLIRHLIHHTSGIRDYITLMDIAGLRYENEYPDDEVIDMISRQKELNFHPGDEYLYSNSGYVLLAEIVKRVSGISLRAFAEEWIFNPLGMINTHFHDDFTEIVKDRATGYSKKGDNGYQICMSIFDIVGDGCVYTTVEDLYLWDQNFYHNIIGGYGDGLIEEMSSPGKLNDGEVLVYAFALELGQYQGLRTVSHSGAWVGYRSELIRFPEQRFSVIILSNYGDMNATGLAKRVADCYLADVSVWAKDGTLEHGEIIPVELPNVELADKVGFYRDQKSGIIWELTYEDGKLFAEVSGEKFQIAPTSPILFHAVDFPYRVRIEFDLQSSNDAVQMQISIEGQKPDRLLKINTDDIKGDELEEYAGIYTCEELMVSYRLIFKENKLVLARRGASKEIIKPLSKDYFKSRDYSFQFMRDEEKTIVGFVLGADRVKNLRFIREKNALSMT